MNHTELNWNNVESKLPPEGKVLLVSGPLGVDLAIKIDGHWYYKQGDSWNQNNLECWDNFTPTQWSEFGFPSGRATQIQEEDAMKDNVNQGQKGLSGEKGSHSVAELSLLAWI